MQKLFATFLFAALLLLFLGQENIDAASPPTDEEVISFIQEASQAQLSLGDKHRTSAEIRKILDPYFHHDYQEKFMQEHLFQEKQGYITYGTDFAVFYIPFFTYSEETKIVRDDGTITVYEYFSTKGDLASLYEDHFEFIRLKETENSWKVAEYGFQTETPEFLTLFNENNNGKEELYTALQMDYREYINYYRLTTPFPYIAFYHAINQSLSCQQAVSMYALHYLLDNSDEKMMAGR